MADPDKEDPEYRKGDMWIVGIALIAFLTIFAFRVRELNIHEFLSTLTPKFVVLWLVLTVVVLAARKLIYRLFSRKD